MQAVSSTSWASVKNLRRTAPPALLDPPAGMDSAGVAAWLGMWGKSALCCKRFLQAASGIPFVLLDCLGKHILKTNWFVLVCHTCLFLM